jgi:hypothetical protein
MSKVVPIGDRKPKPGNWSNEELAELYRVEHALVQSGIALETGCGLTDEGDPWFVFCRRQGEVLVHLTRYDGLYRLYSPAFPEPLIGLSFPALTKSFVSGLRMPLQQSGNVSVHPAALLSVLVAAIFYAFDFHSKPAQAAKEAEDSDHGQSSHLLPDLPTSDALNQAFVGGFTAFCNRTSEAVSSILAKVETAAILFATAVVVFANHGHADAAPDADDAAVALAAEHQIRPTDKYPAPDEAEQHHANAAGSAPSHIALSSDAQDTFQAVPTVGGVSANREGIASDKATAPGPQSSPVQSTNFGYNPEAATVQEGNASAAVADESAVASVVTARLHDNSFADGLPVILAGQQGENEDGGEHVINLTLTDGAAASVSGADNGGTININLAGVGGSIDLSGANGINTLTVAGDGSLLITGIASLGSPEIIIAPHYDVSLTFGAESAGAAPVIKLSGQDQLSLTDAPKMPLTLDSEGTGSNTVTIADAAVSGNAAFDLKIVGIQNLLLQESAAAFDNTQIQSSAFSGSLTVGLDLQNASQSVDLSKVNASTFIVGDGNVALLAAESGANIELGSNLSTVEVSVKGATAATPASLSFDLSSGSGQPAAEFIKSLVTPFTSDVSISSSGAGSTGVNTIATLLDPSLSVLTLTGDSPLTIGAIEGPTLVNGQGITIDAHEFSGVLNLDVSDIADTAVGGGSITIIGGSGWNVLTNLTAAGSTTFILGPGANTINISAGSVSDTVNGLTGNTGVTVGSDAGYADTTIDALNAGTSQASIDSQTSLIAAAQAASSFAGSSAAHQALLFTYQGVQYAFIDASGSHVFDPAVDAIVKLIGIPANANLAGIFHSA